MTPEQRQIVERLLWESVTEVLFSTLVALDQFPGGLVDILVFVCARG